MPNAAECHQIVPDGRGQGQRHGHDQKNYIFMMKKSQKSKETDQASRVNTVARRFYLCESSHHKKYFKVELLQRLGGVNKMIVRMEFFDNQEENFRPGKPE